MGQNGLGLDKKLNEAEAKVQILEKRLANAQQDAEYARQLYQDASTSATVMREEVSELKSQQEDLVKKASENLTRVHEIQAQSTLREQLRYIARLQTQNKELEIELERVREEARQARYARQTRQTSVPRSPRMGTASPRAPGRVAGSASGRTSPVPGMGSFIEGPPLTPGAQFLTQQTGNGRWGHLKD